MDHLLTTLRNVSIASALTAAGCYADGQAGYRVTYAAHAPDLVYVSPGVYVIADLDAPVFFANGVYWRYDGGVWYRSRSHLGGWSVTASVPVAVGRIDRPMAYVHYRATAVTRAPSNPEVRDHRGTRRAAPPRASPSARSAGGRDHRRR